MSAPNTRFRTAVHALAVVAYLPEREATSDKVAASISTDASVARRVLALLRSAGLLTAIEGRSGGYVLAKPAHDIRLDEVYDAVIDVPLFPVPVREANQSCPVGSNIHAVLDGPLAEAESALRTGLHRTSLADVMRALITGEVVHVEPPRDTWSHEQVEEVLS